MRWQNDRNAILYDISFSGKVERVPFHPLSSHFLKKNQFGGGSCDETHVTIGPKGALGSQKHVEEEIFQREGHLTISQEILCKYKYVNPFSFFFKE